jgi:hypothetical protein
MNGSRLAIVFVAAAATWAVSVATAQDSADIPLDHPAIQYARPSNDPVATLLRNPEGMSRLVPRATPGYLRSLLDALGVPVESQILVFSKGSLQSMRIEARNPRALYFNDSVAIGWVRGGLIEIAAQDPSQGTVFYLANSGPQPSMTRADNNCLSCHASYRTDGIPGMIERMGHTRPLEERWGGWYVTGMRVPRQHFGNVDVADFFKAPSGPPAALTSLEKTFDVSGYLTPYSDIAALLVFEHQMQLMNLFTRLGWEARVAAHENRLDSQQTILRQRVEQVVDHMLFVDEAPMSSAIEGSSGFTRAFSSRGPRDVRGRSLYQLDLTTRMFRHPCSYMIYSKQFEALPAGAKAAVYQRLWAVLSGAVNDRKYRHLSVVDRRAIVEILKATKTDLPEYFQSAG